MNGLSGKVAVVTGGGSGIGRAICVRLAKEGAAPAIVDIDGDGAEKTKQLIVDGDGKASAYAADITDYARVKAVIKRIEADDGPIEILVNNAGWDEASSFLDTSPDLWRKVIDINYLGPIHLHHAVLPQMVERGRGRVINIASDAGRVGSSGEAVYSGCKAGVIALTKTLARELARRGITLNSVCPGPTETPLFHSFAGDSEAGQKLVAALTRSIPLGRLGQPDDYPGIVAFLASDDASYITGQTISVSGGLTMHG